MNNSGKRSRLRILYEYIVSLFSIDIPTFHYSISRHQSRVEDGLAAGDLLTIEDGDADRASPE